MGFDWHLHRRRSLRLTGYDYSRPGAYFVTLCVKDRQCLFGDVVDGKMVLNEAGGMVWEWYRELENKFSRIRCGPFICMPNHAHFIIVIVGADLCVRPFDGHYRNTGAHIGAPLPQIVKWFKTMTTNANIRGVRHYNWPPFQGKLWQRNYFEHIIRNKWEWNYLRRYIHTNPQRWPEDPLNIALGQR